MFILVTDPRSQAQLLINSEHIALVARAPDSNGTLLSIKTGRTDLTPFHASESFEDICAQLDVPVIQALGDSTLDTSPTA